MTGYRRVRWYRWSKFVFHDLARAVICCVRCGRQEPLRAVGRDGFAAPGEAPSNVHILDFRDAHQHPSLLRRARAMVARLRSAA